ncbi:AAA domain-containing protein [Pavlovales sp. CCMP2436]|nr:AAA domain-containing protein [Pavlovales sp. CCMP2436]
MTSADRALPNVLITGTPGTGKTTMGAQLGALLPAFTRVELGELIKAKQLHAGWDAENEAYLWDEDKICDELEEPMSRGGVILDFHGADFFPERWFDLVVVLRTDNSVLHGRLSARRYPAKKLQENIEAEIMQVVLDEVIESYQDEIIVEWQSDSLEQLEANVARVAEWAGSWAGAGTRAPGK